MVTVRNHEVMSDKFNVVSICTTVNYAQDWVTK
jgi:hypothetical protein